MFLKPLIAMATHHRSLLGRIFSKSLTKEMVYHCIYTVEFADENTGWAGGENGVIYKSTNGGSTWLPLLALERND